jgi:hypothetical protein
MKISFLWLFVSSLSLLIVYTWAVDSVFNESSSIVMHKIGFYTVCIVNLIVGFSFYHKDDKVMAYKFFNNILYLILSYGLFLNAESCKLMN